MLKKVFSLLLTIGLIFVYMVNLKCFAKDNSTICVVWNEYLDFSKKYNEEDYNNWKKYFGQEGKCYENYNVTLEKRLAELEEKINRNNNINIQLSMIIVFFVGLIFSKPFWQILNAASMKIDLWSEGVFNEWKLLYRVNKLENLYKALDERLINLGLKFFNQRTES